MVKPPRKGGRKGAPTRKAARESEDARQAAAPPPETSASSPATPPKSTRASREKVPPPPGLDPLDVLSRDLRNAALTLGDEEARFLVDAYYMIQRDRIRGAHQVRTLAKEAEPNGVLQWVMDQSGRLEESIQKALDAYSNSHIEGRWARSQVGIGPVIAAGLLANIDIHQAPTVGHIWRYAGLDPTSKWLPNTKRPWNASLKRLCFIVGESFTKFQGHENDVYGKLYRARRLKEVRQNDEGKFIDQAKRSLEEKKFRKETDAFAWYSGSYPAGTCTAWNEMEAKARQVFPDDSAKRQQWLTKERNGLLLSVRVDPGKGQQMLPPARILLRAQRYPVKLFLSHFHHVLHETRLGGPPRKPFILTTQAYEAFPEIEGAFKQLGAHGSYFGPPNWPMQEDGAARN